jgi:hypothetical protein
MDTIREILIMTNITSVILEKFAYFMICINNKNIFYFYVLLVLVINFGTISIPVAGNEYSYKLWILNNDGYMANATIPSNYSYLRFNKSIYNPSEMKFSTDLLHLISPEKDPRINPDMINSTIQTLKNANEYKLTGDTIVEYGKPGNATTVKTDMVYVTIGVVPGTSTHILDPYLYPPIRREEDYIGLFNKWNGNGVDAWVEFTKLKEIANISEVIDIQTLTTGSP